MQRLQHTWCLRIRLQLLILALKKLKFLTSVPKSVLCPLGLLAWFVLDAAENRQKLCSDLYRVKKLRCLLSFITIVYSGFFSFHFVPFIRFKFLYNIAICRSYCYLAVRSKASSETVFQYTEQTISQKHILYHFSCSGTRIVNVLN